jgi:hypothetical protein
MVVRVGQILQFWLDDELDAVGRERDFRKRQKQILKILERWRKFGDAEQAIGSDGQVHWRASEQLLERLKEGRWAPTETVDDDEW